MFLQHNNKTTLIVFLTTALTLASCSFFKSDKNKRTEAYSDKRTEMEAEAAHRLAQARKLLALSNCKAARQTIEQMRKDCYLAITARNEAILLMDSVDLQEAKHELSVTDSLLRMGCDTIGQSNFDEACRKVEFYERKLQHDKKQAK